MGRFGAHSRSAAFVGGLVAVAAVGFSLAPTVSAASSPSAAPAATRAVPTHPGTPRGFAPRHAATGAQNTIETRVCTGCTPPLLYNGGPVMGSSATTGANTEYSIYWDASNAPTPFSASFKNIVDQYMTDVAADSGKTTNVYSADTQYYQQPQGGAQSNITYASTFGGRLPATDPLPANGCNPDPGFTNCLTDAQLQTEIAAVIAAQNKGSATDLAHMFILFTPPGVETCDNTNSCSANVFCGYHSNFTLGAGTVLYSDMPYSTTQGCASGQQPNGDPIADGEIDTLSHEMNETITDPLGNGWADSTGHEDGDECSNVYGTPIGSSDPANAQNTQYNQVINGHFYYTQEEFSNSTTDASAPNGSCIQFQSQPAAPGNTVAVSPSPTRIPADGTSTSTITVTVTAPGGAPVANDEVDFNTFSTTGHCGTVSPTKATTSAGGVATTTYTASTANDEVCSIIATETLTGQAGQNAVVQGGEAYHALPPFRLADTRGTGCPTCLVGGPSVGPGGVLTVPIRGQDGVPADATAAVINVTTTGGTASSFLTAYGDGPRPTASNLNFVAGQTVANLVTAPISSSGAVNIFNLAGTTDVIVDLEGYMEPGAGPAGLFNPLPPARVTDTRPGSGEANAGATLQHGGTLAVQVGGAGGVPATGVSAVVLNVVAVGPSFAGFLTAYPADKSQPNASNINFVPGQVVPNRVIVPVSQGPATSQPGPGLVNIYNGSGGTVDVVVDVGGWFTDSTGSTGARFTPIAPTRVADTRAGSKQPLQGRTLGQQATVTVPVAAPLAIPSDAKAVAGNATVVDTTAASYLTVFPGGGTKPTASDLNWVAGQVVPNMIVTQLGGGALSVYNNTGSTDVIVDISGFWS